MNDLRCCKLVLATLRFISLTCKVEDDKAFNIGFYDYKNKHML